MTIKFSEYKRLFTFGCSLTNYKYPTWANILNCEVNKEFYNLGRGGSGNLFIACRIAEANRRYNFCDTDLVAVMYSSFTREDRYFDNQWQGAGNIFNQHIYPPSFVKNFADPAGYFIRDYALIDLTNQYLKTLPSKTLIMYSWPIAYKEYVEQPANDSLHNLTSDLEKIYQNSMDKSKLTFIEFLHSKYQDENFVTSKEALCTYISDTGKLITDGHPNTKVHFEYLNYLNVGLTEKSEKYTNDVMNRMQECLSEKDIVNMFSSDCDTKNTYGLF